MPCSAVTAAGRSCGQLEGRGEAECVVEEAGTIERLVCFPSMVSAGIFTYFTLWVKMRLRDY